MAERLSYDLGFEPAGFTEDASLVVRDTRTGAEFVEPDITPETFHLWKFNPNLPPPKGDRGGWGESGLGKFVVRSTGLVAAGAIVGAGFSVTKHSESEYFDADALPNVVQALDDPIQAAAAGINILTGLLRR